MRQRDPKHRYPDRPTQRFRSRLTTSKCLRSLSESRMPRSGGSGVAPAHAATLRVRLGPVLR